MIDLRRVRPDAHAVAGVAPFTLASIPIALIIFLLMKHVVLGMSRNALKI